MQTHELIAPTIAQADADTAVLATTSARQGDLVLVREGDAPEDASYSETHAMLAAGAHGEHRFLGDAEWRSTEALLIVREGVVVHTDVPDARHDSIRLAPGAWRYHTIRELSTDDVVVEVRD